ncbi:MAG: winged helix-turn-helix domain-containing protein [Hyphomicrobiales bacterium]|nr:winged helix-turn-helix domain-containing protein [Hyphomicrobiales bacterium]MDE2113648.1 winged helix-turn-helix transcriptional regulator [Hyphomicrobiales bacterium]
MEQLADKAGHAAMVLKSISNKWRLLILCQLVKGEKSVGELESLIALSQSALSQHLAVLRNNELVRTRRVSQMIYYSVNGTEVPFILGALYELYCNSSDDECANLGKTKVAAV